VDTVAQAASRAELFLDFLRVRKPESPTSESGTYSEVNGRGVEFYEKGSAKAKGPLDGLPR
jgi:hypothetical protein